MADQLSGVEKEKCSRALATSACVNMRKAARATTRLFDEALEPCGLRSTQLAILLTIAVMERPTQTRVARSLVMEQSTLSRNLKTLENAGLVKIEAARSGNFKTLSVTPEGIERIRDAIPIWARTQSSFTRQFGEDRWSEFLSGLANTVSSVHAATHPGE